MRLCVYPEILHRFYHTTSSYSPLIVIRKYRLLRVICPMSILCTR